MENHDFINIYFMNQKDLRSFFVTYVHLCVHFIGATTFNDRRLSDTSNFILSTFWRLLQFTVNGDCVIFVSMYIT